MKLHADITLIRPPDENIQAKTIMNTAVRALLETILDFLKET